MNPVATNSNLARLAEAAYERRGDYASLLFEGHWHRSGELSEWARDRIGGYKYPREGHILDSIPLTAVGKLDRKSLRGRLL